MTRMARNFRFYIVLGLFVVGLNASNEIVFSQYSIELTPEDSEYVKYTGEGLHVTCRGQDDKEIKWLKPDGTDVGMKGRVQETLVEVDGAINPNELRLVINSVEKADQGEWTCQVVGDEDGGKSFKLNVYIPIKFEPVASVLKVDEYQDVTIRCEVTGHPEPTITWEHNGNSLTDRIRIEDVKLKQLGDGLFIRSVNRTDAGEYTCKAFQISQHRTHGDNQTVLLNVQYKPIMIGHQHKTRFGFLHGYVNLTCEAEGNPKPVFTWFRHGKKVSNNIYNEKFSSTLQIYIGSNETFGEYKCKAKNELGQREHTIDVIEGKKPESPKVFELRGLSSDTFDIDVGAKIDFKKRNKMDIKGFRFELIPREILKENNGSWNKSWVRDFPIADGVTYLLSPLSENTTYLIRVASRNIAGYSDWTGPTEFSTLPKQPFIDRNSAPLYYSPAIANALALSLVFMKRQIML